MVTNLGNYDLQQVRLMMQIYHIDISQFALGMWQFYLLNSNDGIWNIKLEIFRNVGEGVVLCGSEKCSWVDYSTPGNIHFGFVTAYAEIPLPLALLAGGGLESWDRHKEGIVPAINTEWNATFYDNPGDFAAVMFGYSLYQKYGANLSVTQFQAELTVDALNSFQAPPESFVAPGPAVPQLNKYPSGAFNNDQHCLS